MSTAAATAAAAPSTHLLPCAAAAGYNVWRRARITPVATVATATVTAAARAAAVTMRRPGPKPAAAAAANRSTSQATTG